jgi:hypothetical protein
MDNIFQTPLIFDAAWPEGIIPGKPDLAEIIIKAGDQVYTRLADSARGSVRDSLFASAVSLSLWLVKNWWRLRFEPIPGTSVPPVSWRLRHELTAGEGGILWPPIMIYGEGARVIFAPRAGYYDVYGPLGYVKADIAPVDYTEYEEALDFFFEKVIGSCACATDGEALALLNGQLKGERIDAEVLSWRRLEAQLGFDTDEVPDDLMSELQKFQERYGESAVSEAAIASPGSGSARTLQAVLAATYDSPVRISLEVARGLTSAGARPTRYTPPWRLAESCAQELRTVVNAGSGPMNNSALCDVLGVTTSAAIDGPAMARSMAYGAFAFAGNEQNQYALHAAARSRGRRFELARALGDAAWIGNTAANVYSFAPVSSAKSDRQKFQRAFAQSFLCPFSDVIEALGSDEPSDLDIERVAGDFDVSQRVIEMILVNKRIVPRERFADRLEAA